MSNPFEDPEGTYLVLVNHEGQYSLWPSFAEVPAGWSIALPATDRESALGHISENWTDMRPKSLVAAMDEAAT
ncbi:MbtH-like protein [Streptomyces sp. YIM 130001]|uniref:MbtH family protein n=1 Tax=Streptomyces sp. YIM 130001 TaxID=2259644 RepID=UPI000E651D5A|nr:MbtH family protein [Streptomyces sp. YIM 130001]RII13418.1 MbtH-like protein [Streptomyces sp. YIM 130001]